MKEKSKEELFASRQDLYKQEKEDIFKDALGEDYHDALDSEADEIDAEEA